MEPKQNKLKKNKPKKKKTNRLIIKKIDDPIYRASLSIVIGDYDKSIKYIKSCKIGIDDFGEESEGKFYGSDGFSIIWLPRLNLFTLIHELYHYTQNTLHNKGIPINADNDEAGAYFIDMMFQRTAKAFKIKSLIE